MKKILVWVFVMIGIVSGTIAQDDTYNKHDRYGQLSKDSVNVEVMVIPTNPELYNSFFDRQMTELNKLTFYELRDTILLSLSQKVSEAINDSMASAMVPECLTGYKEDMAFVYESISYTYDLVPVPVEEKTGMNKWSSKLNKKDKNKPEKKKGTYMEEGQIVTNADTRPHYTNVKIVNPDFLYLLNKRYHAEKFVFINKYEMEIATTISQVDIQSDNYPREIRVHYTVVDVLGKELTSGIIIRNSSSYDDKLNFLIDDSFTQIGVEIAQKISSVE